MEINGRTDETLHDDPQLQRVPKSQRRLRNSHSEQDHWKGVPSCVRLVKLAFLVAGCHCRHDNTISQSWAMGAAATKYGRHHQSILPPHSSSGCISRLALNLSRVHLYINSSASCLASPIFLLIQVCCFGRLFFGYRRVLCFRSCILFPPWIFASPRSVCRPSGTP